MSKGNWVAVIPTVVKEVVSKENEVATIATLRKRFCSNKIRFS